mgnify:CR=1 FL=1
MREIKFDFVYRCQRTGEIHRRQSALEEILSIPGKNLHMIFVQCADGDWFVPKLVAKRQYTGVKDKNGLEVYEGDVLKGCHEEEEDETYVTQVRFTDGAFAVDVVGQDYDYTAVGWAMEACNEYEVIGNIYENPELLEGGQ